MKYFTHTIHQNAQLSRAKSDLVVGKVPCYQGHEREVPKEV